MSDDILDGGDPVAVAERGTGVARSTTTSARPCAPRPPRPTRCAATTCCEALSDIESRRARVGWSTGGHTGVDVGLYAWGPGSERFHGLHENTDVARLVADLLDLDLEAETARLRDPSATR